MGTASLTEHIDLPQIAVALFFLLFVLLVWHLRRQDKREGYPLRKSPFDASPLLGFPLAPERPQLYLLMDGVTTAAPHDYPQPEIQAEPLHRFDGTPLTPIGNPLLAGIGPGAWVKRRDAPMLTEQHDLMLQPLRLLPDWVIAEGEADPRGMRVFDWRWNEVGQVRDIWIDHSIAIIRFLEVVLNPGLGPAQVLVPIFHTEIRERAREIRVTSLRAHQFGDVPMPAAPDRMTAREEERLNAYYAAGRFYLSSPLSYRISGEAPRPAAPGRDHSPAGSPP